VSCRHHAGDRGRVGRGGGGGAEGVGRPAVSDDAARAPVQSAAFQGHEAASRIRCRHLLEAPSPGAPLGPARGPPCSGRPGRWWRPEGVPVRAHALRDPGAACLLCVRRTAAQFIMPHTLAPLATERGNSSWGRGDVCRAAAVRDCSLCFGKLPVLSAVYAAGGMHARR
jgi:hypothetical protein